MRQKGSILVVVLGLLATLAVIGVAFLTMSSLERSTATSFALQTQMMIAADGALDYAVHQMVIDVWEYSTDDKKLTFRDPPGLLTGINKCEPFDCPGPDDTWLSGNITGNSTPNPISFAGAVVKRFGVNFGGTTAAVDNLGLPGASPAPNGLWIPDLAAPCDQYLVRASVTILDHGALLNANAHGNKNTGEWEYGDCIGKGYFVSDVIPGTSALLTGSLGCWGADNKPGNSRAGAVLIENPYAGQDVPYTLDEEFELRNLWGTYFKSRLEWIWTALDSDPANVSGYTQRLKYTTVSWTAEVRGDGNATDHAKVAGGDWSAPKADLNTASADDIYEALRDGRAWADGDELKQLVANIVTFRRKGVANFTAVSVDGQNFFGAQRQPFFTEATSELFSTEIIDDDPAKTCRRYRVKLEVYNPWPGDWNGGPAGLSTSGLSVKFQCGAGHWVNPSANADLPNTMNLDACFVVERVVVCNNDKTLKDAVQDIRLAKGNDPILDRISSADELQMLENGHMSRKVYHDDTEKRGAGDNSKILKLYVGDWQPGGGETLGSVAQHSSLANSAIPIRFPNCVLGGAKDLAVRPTAAGEDFKAFARVGDLNQVLRSAPPWIVTVSKASLANERNVKFDWMKDINNMDFAASTAAAYAANVLCVGGPWNDGLDNDGDTQIDSADKGTGAGLPGGPEFRVAGKINLNTATPDTLQALTSGVGTSGLGSIAANRPLKTPAQILGTNPATPNGVEKRDAAFTLISNIATVRSDVFSVYGTVQIVDPTVKTSGVITDDGIVRSRRFWALVDRSPSLAYPPTDKDNFIYPRILNFQWLD